MFPNEVMFSDESFDAMRQLLDDHLMAYLPISGFEMAGFIEANQSGFILQELHLANTGYANI